MNQRKKVLQEIETVALHLKTEKNAIASHQHYFSQLIADHRSILFAMLFPAFLLGWRQARHVPKGKRLQGLARFLLTTAFTNLRRHILP